MALPRDVQDIVEVFVLSNLSILMSPNPFNLPGTIPLANQTISNPNFNTTIL